MITIPEFVAAFETCSHLSVFSKIIGGIFSLSLLFQGFADGSNLALVFHFDFEWYCGIFPFVQNILVSLEVYGVTFVLRGVGHDSACSRAQRLVDKITETVILIFSFTILLSAALMLKSRVQNVEFLVRGF